MAPDEHAPTGVPTSPAAPAPHHPFKAVMLLSAAVFLFACMDTTTKYLVTTYEVPVVMAFRYIVHCLLMVILLTPMQGRRLIQTQRTGLVLVRAASLAAASLFMGLALKRMPVAEATAVVFVAPLLVVLIAGHFMREEVSTVGRIAAVAGFIGVLLIARPGGGLEPVGVAYALCAAAVISAYQLLSRVLASTERTIALLFYTALVGAILFGLLLPWFWEGVTPTTLQWTLLLSMGAFGGVGHFLFTMAHRLADASLLAPMMYLQLFWAAVLGWVVFGHVPEGLSIIGMCVVATAGGVVAWKSHLSRRALAEAAQG